MGTSSNIAYQKPNGKVVVMYCHYDGYPKYVGKMLYNHYNHQKKAIALVDNGYQSDLKPTIIESNEKRVHKHLPDVYHSLHAFMLNRVDDVNWIYLFANNEWKVAESKLIQLPSGKWNFKTLHDKDFTPLWAYFTKHNIAVANDS